MTNEKFNEIVKTALMFAGWFPDRNIGDLLLKWKRELTLSDGFEMFPKAETALLEFGGLQFNQEGAGITCARESFSILPTLAIGEAKRFAIFSDHLRTKLYPLGEAVGGHCFLAISEDGRVFLIMEEILIIGQDIEEALKNLILGIKPKEVG